MMNDPEYVYIWVNPGEKTIAICVSDKKNKDAVPIKENRDAEIYSSGLFYELARLNSELSDDRSYMVKGLVMPGNRMAEFNILNSIAIVK